MTRSTIGSTRQPCFSALHDDTPEPLRIIKHTDSPALLFESLLVFCDGISCFFRNFYESAWRLSIAVQERPFVQEQNTKHLLHIGMHRPNSCPCQEDMGPQAEPNWPGRSMLKYPSLRLRIRVRVARRVRATQEYLVFFDR